MLTLGNTISRNMTGEDEKNNCRKCFKNQIENVI